MTLISADSITKSQGARLLFRDISLSIDEGQKVALIGVNGSGKTTLLNILAGVEQVESGSIIRRKGLKVGFLRQVPEYDPESTVLEHIFSSNSPKVRIIKEYEDVCDRLHRQSSPELEHMVAQCTERMDAMNAWEYENEVRSKLTQLGIGRLDLRMGTLSGGMLKKVALAQALLDDAQLLLLDEPTNHLDIDTIEWLEDQLSAIDRTILMVTHDRYFLDKVCTHLYEIADQRLSSYPGNYSGYLEKKSEEEAVYQKQEGKIRSVLRTELQWLSRRPQARATKQKARKERIMAMLSRKQRQTDVMFELGVAGRRLGRKVLELEKISKSFGDHIIIESFSYKFTKGERIGIVGPNGSGKSTFLNLLTGTLSADGGTIDRGETTCFAYFDQRSQELDDSMMVLDFMKRSGEYITLHDGSTLSATQLLQKFLFPPSSFHNRIGKLSGGEKRRLHLVSLLLTNPNFLILDEPTNDLDIRTLSVLEDFLSDFSGCVLVVSHDRYFMDRIADQLFVFDGNGDISGYPGNYTDYLDFKRELAAEYDKQQRDMRQNALGSVRKNAAQEKKKLTFNEQREYSTIEQDIERLETEQASIGEAFSSGTFDPAKYAELTARSREVEAELATKWKRWEYLAQFV